MTQPLDTTELALPTFAVLARFRESGATAEDAVQSVVLRLTAAEEPFHEVTVERQEGPATWMVVARFVLVSVDSATAVAGLHDTLEAAALRPDEVWADRQLS
jgi:hypothetical protein